MKQRGIFIAIEGIDGAGKTTQVELLASALREAGEEVVTSKEPTTGPWGQKIRNSATTGRLSLEEELEAFIKDREEHLENKITPALNQDKIVILDRYFYSTIAYQGSRGGNIEELDNYVRSLAVTPDMVFVLDLDPAVSVNRITIRDGQPNEFEDINNLKAVRHVFDWLCKKDPVVECVDSTLSEQELLSRILGLMLDGVLKQKRCFKQYGCDDQVNCGYRMTGMCDWSKLKDALYPFTHHQKSAGRPGNPPLFSVSQK